MALLPHRPQWVGMLTRCGPAPSHIPQCAVGVFEVREEWVFWLRILARSQLSQLPTFPLQHWQRLFLFLPEGLRRWLLSGLVRPLNLSPVEHRTLWLRLLWLLLSLLRRQEWPLNWKMKYLFWNEYSETGFPG